MIVNLTFDVEEFDFPTERGLEIAFEKQLSVSTEGLEGLLRMLEKHQAKATFYVTANYAQHKVSIVRRILSLGHEIASHDFYHAPGSKLMPAKSKIALEAITGTPVIGYRSPRLAKISADELAAAGYLYNSSMNPTCVPFRYNNLLKPRSIFKEGSILQYPTSVSWPLRIPLFWISFHVMGFHFYKKLAYTALKKDGHLNLYFHPWEFSDRLADSEFGVPGFIANCSGTTLLNKLERLIVDLKNRGCDFQTTKKYLGFDV
ncbi:polysaccharide deacetylase family protein [Sphingobacterium sp. Mn56C]|uniref:polysaccharide deacetylase family protein n=1 Tax=Sphingobacterium sp. Mn56C TaxID=3395261 RepID=UPI003BBFE3F9